MAIYTYEELRGLIQYTTDCNTNLRLVLAYLDPDNSDSYDNWKLSGHVEKDICNNCACSHDIQNNFMVKHNTSGDILIIGSSCVSKFSDKMRKDVNRHLRRLNDNTDSKYCEFSECNKKITKAVVEQFRGQTNFYHKACLSHVFDKCYECNRHKEYDCKCIQPRKCIEEGCSQKIKAPEVWKVRCYSCYANQKKH
jgi:hypothetical protein